MKVGTTGSEKTELFSRKEAALFLGICRTTLDRLDIPKTKVGRRVMYKPDVLIKWIDDHTEKVKERVA
jgi:hypothetical protein